VSAEHVPLITMREATVADLPALTAIRPPEAIHRGRLRDAERADYTYFVFLHGEEIVGFGSLVFRRPASWANAKDVRHLPEINDLHVAEAERGKGYGSAAIRLMEQKAAEAGSDRLYISVEPFHNPRAYALYQRLGYKAIQSEPYFHQWAAVDGDGNVQRGEDWLVDTVKVLT
jgi:GNAT superfamily N-acetyltransferase